jgi:glyoxylase I family protein
MTGLSHVQFLVSDVRVSAAWYTDALGLEPYAEDLENGYVALRHRAARIVVVLTSAPSPDDGGRLRSGGADTTVGVAGALDHLAFTVPDEDALRAWADHLTGIGLEHPGVVDELGKPSLQLRDPDGIAIELVAPGSGAVTRPSP